MILIQSINNWALGYIFKVVCISLKDFKFQNNLMALIL